MELPAELDELAIELYAARGCVAVVVGGSRATGQSDSTSDWDLGVYYRGELDLAPLASRGEVHPPGSWGRLMNGGAWLDLDGGRVDVLLRDLEVVEHWTAEAGAGRFEVDGLLGYVAGLPTYSLTAEAAIAEIVHGSVDLPKQFPDPLRHSAPERWRFHRDFSLSHAASHAARGNVVGTVAHAARAVLEEAHARRCSQGRWTLNEKRLLDGCALDSAAALLAAAGASPTALERLVRDLAAVVRAPDLE